MPQPEPVAQPVMARTAGPIDGATNELDRLLIRLDAEEKALKSDLDAAGPELEVIRARMLVRGRAYYKHVRAGLLPAGGGFDALVDHAARVERTRRALDRDIAAEAALMKRSSELAQRLERVRIERAPLEVHREAMVRDRAALQAADERRAAFARAFDSSIHPPDYVAIYGADLGPSDTGSAGFRALRGRLPFPLPGRAEVRRVRRGGGPGLEFVAPAGTAVRSVAAGRVVFADRYDDYGLTVIVDHGDQYFSIYGSLGLTELAAGGVVPANGRIGTVGAASGGAPLLYFELRRSAETLDPGPWLGL
ncbi:MAG: peptidoglycan DD-metalloendopeptidase family protein [Polyangiaceae bacterium]